LYGFQLREEAADQMTTLPATHMGLSETLNLEFETQKSERETLVVLKEVISHGMMTCSPEMLPNFREQSSRS
jgi:hypothetical protein